MLKPNKAREALWKRGKLGWMLRPHQLRAYEHFYNVREVSHLVMTFHRGAGKTFLANILADEAALAGKKVMYVGPNEKLVRAITFPVTRQILQTCPRDMRPTWRKEDSMLLWSTGGSTRFGGANAGGSDNLRGQDIDVAFIDEEAYVDDPDYLINSVIIPRLSPNGKIVHISTPPTSPSHPFAARMRQAEAEGYLFKLPVTENPLISREQVERFAKEAGGRTSTAFRREQLCEIVTEEKLAVIPELVHKQILFLESDFPGEEYIGVHFDPTGLSLIVFSRYNEETDHLHVYEEKTARWATLRTVAQLLGNRADKALVSSVVTEEFRRNFAVQHDIGVRNIEKTYDPKAAIDVIRTLIDHNRFTVSASCPVTRRHLTDAVWNDQKTKLTTSGDESFFGGISALSYITGNLGGFHGAEPRAHEMQNLEMVRNIFRAHPWAR